MIAGLTATTDTRIGFSGGVRRFCSGIHLSAACFYGALPANIGHSKGPVYRSSVVLHNVGFLTAQRLTLSIARQGLYFPLLEPLRATCSMVAPGFLGNEILGSSTYTLLLELYHVLLASIGYVCRGSSFSLQ